MISNSARFKFDIFGVKQSCTFIRTKKKTFKQMLYQLFAKIFRETTLSQ